MAPNAQQANKLGEIHDVRDVDPAVIGIPEVLRPNAVFQVELTDPYVEQFGPEEVLRVKTHELESDYLARQRREAGLWERKPHTVYYDLNGNPVEKHTWGDPEGAAAKFFGELGSPAIDAWKTNIPSAKALKYLSDPNSNQFVEAKDGTSVPMDETGRLWLSLCTDAIGIRSRATVMAEVVKQHAEDNADRELHWLSVGCGTALPTMKAATYAGIKPHLDLVDLDTSAMNETEELAGQIGFDGEFTKHRSFIFDPRNIYKIGAKLGAEGRRPDLIDLMGIFEYTGDNIEVSSVEFLKAIYDILAPGGRLVFGQMRSDRPVPDFTMGTVGWDYVEMRSPAEFLAVIEEAGIPLDRTKLFLPEDGVYTVGVIDKPAA
jgi:SAM-dependent methyltransferase